MKNKLSLLVLFAFVSSVLSACVSGGSVTINCVGFSLNGLSVVNNAPPPGNQPIVVNASEINPPALPVTLFTGFVGAVNNGSTITFSTTQNWQVKPTGAPGSSITLTVNGTPYPAGKCDPNNPNAGFGGPNVFSDGRINPDPDATIVGYCNNGALKVWAIVSDKWRLVGTISKRAILAGLEKAVNSGQHVLLLSKAGQQVWALSSNELQFHNAMGFPYDAIFPGNVCG